MLLASTFTLGKAALAYTTPVLLIGIRMTISGLLLLGYLYFFKRSKWKFEKKHLGLFAQIVFFHVYFAYILEFWAMDEGVSSSKACLLFNLTPFVTALILYFLYAQRLNLKKFAGLIIGFLGFLPILMAETQTEQAVRAAGFISWPEIALLGAVVCCSYGWIVMGRFVNKEGYSAIMVNGVGMLVGGILALGSSLITEGAPKIVDTYVPTDALAVYFKTIWGVQDPSQLAFWTYIALLTLTANIIFYNFYGYLLKRYSPTFLSFAGFTAPLFAALFGWMLLGETVSIGFFASIAIVAFGLYLFYQEELKAGESAFVEAMADK